MKRILYVAHLQSHIRQFHLWYLRHLKEAGYYVAVATRVDNRDELAFLDDVYDIPFERSPLRLSNLKTYKLLRRAMKAGRFDIVHCHTPVAGILTRLGSHGLNHKVYYTAHGFHFFKGAPLINWLIYFPAEYICSYMTDVLFTMNSEDYQRAKKWFHHPQIQFIHGVGIDVDKYKPVSMSNHGCSSLRLISVGELNTNKNHMLVLEALRLLDDPRVEYQIAGEGPLHDSIQQFIKTNHLEKRVKLLGFRKDVIDLLHQSDIFIFPSKREGLSLALMEAMASGLPAIVSDIRGNRDLIDDQQGGFICSINPGSIANAIRFFFDNPSAISSFGMYNRQKVTQYAKTVVQQELDAFYF